MHITALFSCYSKTRSLVVRSRAH